MKEVIINIKDIKIQVEVSYKETNKPAKNRKTAEPKIPGIKRGDKVRIAEMTGCTLSYVRKVLDGDRDSNSRMAKKINEALDAIIKNREYIKHELLKIN